MIRISNKSCIFVLPYAIKDTLDFLLLKSEEDSCLAKIIGINTVAGTRFRFKGPGEPSIEDPNGDSCIWEVQFEVVPGHRGTVPL